MLRVLLVCAVSLAAVQSAKIIGIFMTPSYSHQVVFQPIWKQLSLEGHDVTVITTNPLNDPTLTNLTEIDIGPFSYNLWKKSPLPELGVKQHSSLEELKSLQKIYNELADALLGLPLFQDLIKNGREMNYDLFLVEYLHPSMMPFKDIFNCPMVGISSLPLHGSFYPFLGMDLHPVLNPPFVIPYAKDLTFSQRFVATVLSKLMLFGRYMETGKNIQALITKHFGENTRKYYDIMSEVSMVLCNSNMVTQNMKPTVPQYVEIAGIHLNQKKQLPADLKQLLDQSKEGVIYFSLGTNVKSSLLPPEKLKAFLEAFKDLPYKVLWKFETDDVPELPKNVIIRKWMPQQDVLGHPNVKLFITQGGLQSLDEAIHNEVPVLVIPFFGDQKFNADMIQKNGGALVLDFHDFTSQEMKDKIVQLIENKQYKQTVSKLSKIAFDKPMPALDTAVWHINYVLRHQGAPHLEYKARTMTWYQYWMVDVYASMVLIAITLGVILFKITQLLWRLLIQISKLGQKKNKHE